MVDRVGQQTEMFSPTFTCDDNPLRASFRMKLSFGTEGKRTMELVVQCVSKPVRLVESMIEVYINDGYMESFVLKKSNFRSAAKRDGACRSWKEVYSQPVDKKVLRVICDVNYVNDVRDVPDVVKKIRDPRQPRELGQHLASLLSKSQDADFTIRVEDKKLRCHKVVLMARSSYFRGLFLSGM